MSVVGSIAVNVVARTAAFIDGMKKSKRELLTFQKAVSHTQKVVATATSLAGTIAGASFIHSIKQSADRLDELGKTADRIGVTTEALAGLQHGAGLAGIESTVLDKSMQGLARRLSEAATGTGEAVGVLADLKMNAAELNRLSPDKALGRIADEMNRLANQSDKVRVATKLFGEEGVKMLNFMSEGSAGIEKYRKEAEKLGLAISREDIAKVEQMNDAMTRLGKAWDGVKGEITINIAPAATQALETLQQYIQSTKPHGAKGKLSRFDRQSQEKSVNYADLAIRPDKIVPLTRSISRALEDYLIRGQLKLEKPTAPQTVAGAKGLARFGFRNPFKPTDAGRLEWMSQVESDANEVIKQNKQRREWWKKSKISKPFEWLFNSNKEGGLSGVMQGAFGQLHDWKDKARGIGLQFQRDFIWGKFFGKKNGISPVIGKSSANAQMPLGGNEIVERGTQAAYQASKASDHVAKILREQLQIGKQQVEQLAKIATNTGGGDVFSMGTA